MTSAPANFLVRVVADYQAPYADPIQVDAGDEVVMDRGKQTDIAGWVWCTNSKGKSGWVPTDYIEQIGEVAKMRREYNAIELTARVGETLTVHKSESDFYWATNQKGLQGWIPISHVEAFEDEFAVQDKEMIL